MSVNEKTLLPEDQSLEPSYALRPHTSLIESGNGEWTPSVPAGAVETADAPQLSSYLHALRRHWLIAVALHGGRLSSMQFSGTRYSGCESSIAVD
jgi:hypothetical protein